MPHSVWLLIIVASYFVALYLVNRKAQLLRLKQFDVRSLWTQSCPHKPQSLVLKEGEIYVCYGCMQEQIHERRD